MTQQEFIDLIPQVLLYIVPGFFVLMMIEAFTQRKKQSPMETILWSIFFSFLVEILLQFCVSVRKSLSPTATIALSVLLSGLLGFVLVKLINSELGKWIVSKLNFNLEPGGDFWFEALRSKRGVWAIVYMKNGMIYRGQLINYTTDPNDPVKMLTLTNICSQVPKTPEEIKEDDKNRQPGQEKSYYRIVRDDTNKKKAKVLLKFEDILSIELGP